MRRITTTIALVSLATAFAFSVPSGAQFSCTEVGGDGPDRIRGTPGDDVICSGAGNDRISALGGNDHVFAGPGNDGVQGGGGADHVYGGSGDDVLYGGDGRDEVHEMGGRGYADGGARFDIVSGGRGGDRCLSTRRGGHDGLRGGPGTDTYYADARDDVRSAENEESCIVPVVPEVMFDS